MKLNQSLLERVGYDSFSALVLEDEVKDLPIEIQEIHVDTRWDEPQYQYGRNFGSYTVTVRAFIQDKERNYFEVEFQGRDIKKIIQGIIAIGKAYQ